MKAFLVAFRPKHREMCVVAAFLQVFVKRASTDGVVCAGESSG
jgi:hypothetical protein